MPYSVAPVTIERATHLAVERAARDAYGRLLALTARRSRDIVVAEDALGDAFRAALEHWPVHGVPDAPDAWLLTAARRSIGHVTRHSAVRQQAHHALEMLHEERAMAPATPFADKRLELMFVCAHPAVDPAMHTPLMLQTVLGLDAARIASAFLLSPTTMGQRLVRAKTKIRDAGIAFVVPEPEEAAPRLAAVLRAIYVAYGTGWDDVLGSDARQRDLTGEALHLAELVVMLIPDAADAHGLLALMLHCEARAAARRTAQGQFVPLAAQNVDLWSRPLIAKAEHHLRIAARYRVYGRFQTEAAIQSVHAQRRLVGQDDGSALILLYDLLVRHDPAIGAQVARAVAYGERDPHTGLAILETLSGPQVASYQPYWAALAHLLTKADQKDAAIAAYDRAIGLAEDPAARTYLTEQRDKIANSP